MFSLPPYIESTFQIEEAHAEVLQGPNLNPLEPILLFGLCAEAAPSVRDMCFQGYWSHLAFSLIQVISFPSISI